MPEPDKIEIESITSPGRTQWVDRGKYSAMRSALLGVLPQTGQGAWLRDVFPGRTHLAVELHRECDDAERLAKRLAHLEALAQASNRN